MKLLIDESNGSVVLCPKTLPPDIKSPRIVRDASEADLLLIKKGVALIAQPIDPQNHEGAWKLVETVKPKVIPRSISAVQLRLLLPKLGLGSNASEASEIVSTKIDQNPDPIQRAELHTLFEYSTYFHREDPRLIALATALGITTEQLDNGFILAATL